MSIPTETDAADVPTRGLQWPSKLVRQCLETFRIDGAALIIARPVGLTHRIEREAHPRYFVSLCYAIVRFLDDLGIKLDATRISTEVDVKHLLPAISGGRTLSGPGQLQQVTLNAFRASRRIQELAFHLSRDLTRRYQSDREDSAPSHVLFPQILKIVERYVAEKVEPGPPTQRIDAFLSPYYGWVIERLAEAIKPDASAGEDAELPVLGTKPIRDWIDRRRFILDQRRCARSSPQSR